LTKDKKKKIFGGDEKQQPISSLIFDRDIAGFLKR
jgi:hypothetical protein